MAVASPNFGGLFKRQQALEGKYRNMQVGASGAAQVAAGMWHAIAAGVLRPAVKVSALAHLCHAPG
jgi:hypothetical protein